MEAIILFLEQYWGVTVVGGVTVGTLITFIILQAKALLAQRAHTVETDQLSKLVENALSAAQQVNLLYTQAQAQRAYSEQVQAATFKAISYIVIASKLPIEDKLALQAEFTRLQENATQLLTPPTVEPTAPAVLEAVAAPVVEAVKEAATGAVNLLAQYVTKGA